MVTFFDSFFLNFFQIFRLTPYVLTVRIYLTDDIVPDEHLKSLDFFFIKMCRAKDLIDRKIQIDKRCRQ